MTNPPRPPRPDQPGQQGRPTGPSRPSPSSRPAAAGRPGRAPAQRIGGTAGAAGRGDSTVRRGDGPTQRPSRPVRPTASRGGAAGRAGQGTAAGAARGTGSNAGRGRGAAWGKIGGAGAAKRGGAGQRGPAQRMSGLRGQAQRGNVQRGNVQRGSSQRSAARSANAQPTDARGGKRTGLAAFFGTDALANKRTYLIIGAIVLVFIIVIAAIASQRSSSTNAAATVTAITSSTVAGENRTSAPDAEAPAGDKAVTPDLSGLAMDPNSDPNAKAYFRAVKKGGIPVKDGMETALLGMGYTHCQAKMSNDKKTDEIQDVMMDTLVQMTPGVNKAKAKKVIYASSDKYLCPSLQKRQ